jgi:cytochrome c oxidase cbb3-type subunit 3
MRRPPADPARVERGSTLYGIHCRGCHGADLRGGDLGGPNLLRSQLVQSDNDGELLLPIIQGSRQAAGMPAIRMSPEDITSVATYIHSVLAGIGRQGTPPSIGAAAPSVLVGNASAGQAYFDTKCARCHSPTGDLRGIATRISSPKELQNTWVRGGARNAEHDVSATVTMPSGESVQGRLIRIDPFLVTLELPGGAVRTFGRDGDVPKVDVRDPLKAHRDLLSVYSDKEMHDVTAYLVTLK